MAGRRPMPLRASPALVHEGHRLGALHVARLQPIDVKAGRLDQPGDAAVQVAAAPDAFPHGGKPVLPPLHGGFRSQPVLHEEQLAARA